MLCETTSLDDDLYLLFDVEDDEPEERQPEEKGSTEPLDICVTFRNGLLLEPVEDIFKLEEQTRPFDSVVEYMFYDDPRGERNTIPVEKHRRRTAFQDAVSFLEWVLSPEVESTPTTVTFIELVENFLIIAGEDEKLDADVFRECLMAKLKPVFTPKFRQMLTDYMELAA